MTPSAQSHFRHWWQICRFSPVWSVWNESKSEPKKRKKKKKKHIQVKWNISAEIIAGENKSRILQILVERFLLVIFKLFFCWVFFLRLFKLHDTSASRFLFIYFFLPLSSQVISQIFTFSIFKNVWAFLKYIVSRLLFCPVFSSVVLSFKVLFFTVLFCLLYQVVEVLCFWVVHVSVHTRFSLECYLKSSFPLQKKINK